MAQGPHPDLHRLRGPGAGPHPQHLPVLGLGMSRTLKWILAVNLAVLAILAFVYPHLMVGPGKLIPGHAKLEADCFACNSAFTGAESQRCTTCHKPQDIGKLTTVGLPIDKPLTKTPDRKSTR